VQTAAVTTGAERVPERTQRDSNREPRAWEPHAQPRGYPRARSVVRNKKARASARGARASFPFI